MQITNLMNGSGAFNTASHPNYKEENDSFAIDVLTGLCSQPKQLSAKYFYDDAGSELFQKITQHDDYYPTRTEFDILSAIKHDLPALFGAEELDIIELGAGDGHKSKLLLDGFLAHGKRINFYPIDISEKALQLMQANIRNQDLLNVHGVVGDYFDGLQYIKHQSNNPALVLFLGSNIGNFDRSQNQGFLRKLWNSLQHGDHALIGFDLKKDIATLTRAYNDSSGFTRDFNLNLLKRINSELGGNFDLSKFQHFGSYNPILGAMESFLVATEDQDVYISSIQRSFHFSAFEPMHLEYSFKFLTSDVDYLSNQTGFEVVEHFTDPKDYFLDSLWRVEKAGLN